MEAAAEKQASNIAMLDIKEICSFTDYFVICSGDTTRHIEAIWQAVDETLRQNNVIPYHSEGTSDSGWVITDFGSVIVHIFAPAERDYYQLDKLWDKGIPVIRIQ